MEKSKVARPFDTVESFSQAELKALFNDLKVHMEVSIENIQATSDTDELTALYDDYVAEIEAVMKLLKSEQSQLTPEEYSLFVETMHEMSIDLFSLEDLKKFDQLPLTSVLSMNEIILQSLDHLYRLKVISHRDLICRQLYLCWRYFRHVMRTVNQQAVSKPLIQQMHRQFDHFLDLLKQAEDNYRIAHQDEVEQQADELQDQMKRVKYFGWIRPLQQRMMSKIEKMTFALKHPLFSAFAEIES